MTERTVVIGKPETVLAEEVEAMIAELEELGMTIVASRRCQLTPDEGERLYRELLESGKPWFHKAVKAITRGPVVCLLVQGEDAIRTVRLWRGPTNADEAVKADCFRGRMLRKHGFAEEPARETTNYVHSSGNALEARAEIAVVFPWLSEQ